MTDTPARGAGMNKQIKRLAAFLLLCYLALFWRLNWLQVFKAEDYNEHSLNNRAVVRDFSRPRGVIQTVDGVVIAESVPSDDRWERQRVYPFADLYAHLTGSFSFSFGSSGLEQQYNDELAGRTAEQQIKTLGDLFVERTRVGDLTITVDSAVQEVARAALGEQEGSVVAIDPRTGGIYAMWSWPSYDPNLLATHDFEAAKAAREMYLASPKKPLLANSYQERYFPGSTFKIVTAAAGLETGFVTPDLPVYPVAEEYIPPQTDRPVRNFGGAECGGNLIEIMRVSCNTAFAQMGVDLGATPMVAAAEAFGFNQVVPIDLPRPARSFFPAVTDFDLNIPKLAQSAFGQNDVQATPLQMAMVAAAVANGGELMVPHMMVEVRDSDGEVVLRSRQRTWKQVTSPITAAILREAMKVVVASGTGQNAQLPLEAGGPVAGKTDTAQLGTDPPSSHAWFIGFAPADNPRVAVAVLVKAQPGVSEVTGGRVAAPIAREVMSAVLSRPDPTATRR